MTSYLRAPLPVVTLNVMYCPLATPLPITFGKTPNGSSKTLLPDEMINYKVAPLEHVENKWCARYLVIPRKKY
jgi:hypothetical protein